MTATTVTGVTATRPSAIQQVVRVLRRYPIVQLAGLVVAFAIGAASLDGFGSPRGIANILITASFLGIAAAGQTLVVLIGGIDMSVSSTISSAAILTSFLYGVQHWSDWAAFVLVLIFAMVVGALNGYIGQRFGANPLIVTLGIGYIAVGLAQVITGGGSDAAQAPAWVGTLSRPVATTFGVPIPPVVSIWIVLAAAIVFLGAKSTFGRRIYATGASQPAARLALVRVNVVWIVVFAISGLCAGGVGILLAGFAGSGNITLGDPYLFMGIAAVIVGGTTTDGRGDYLRTCIAALLLTVIQTLLIGYGFTTADQQIIYGVLILIAVAGYIRTPRLRTLV